MPKFSRISVNWPILSIGLQKTDQLVTDQRTFRTNGQRTSGHLTSWYRTFTLVIDPLECIPDNRQQRTSSVSLPRYQGDYTRYWDHPGVYAGQLTHDIVRCRRHVRKGITSTPDIVKHVPEYKTGLQADVIPLSTNSRTKDVRTPENISRTSDADSSI